MSKNLQIEWVSFPAVENLRKTTIATIFIIGLSTLLYFLYGPIYGFLSILFLGFSLLPYYTPTTYRLNEDGIEVKKVFYTIKKSWSNFRSFYPDKNGVLLSPFPIPTRLENFRGIYIRFRGNREGVLSVVESMMDRAYEKKD
ncbi:MAG: hypothetical protein E3J23_01495 [Candidatus Stahlbacteria bacterium]|nr:MAG: hypothetical protein E3J23_01495 [Candidatus Stahlbacteria bacterium]